MTECLLLVLAVLLFASTPGAAAPLPQPVRGTFICTRDGSRWPYLLQLPEGEVAAVLVYLHGHYSDHHQGMAEDVYNDAFGKLRRECRRRNWAYITAWYGGNSWMGPVAEAGLVDLLKLLQQRWPGQPIYLCGGSMGGSSALVFAHRQPQLLAGLLAFCPAGDIQTYYACADASANPTLQNIAAAIQLHYTTGGADLASELAARSATAHAEAFTMPVYLSHGTADTLIPPDGVRGLVRRLQALGKRVRYRELPGGGHDDPILQVDWVEALDFISQH